MAHDARHDQIPHLRELIFPSCDRPYMKKLDARDPETESRGIIAENIEQLKVLFPEAWTDGKIDFDVLKQLLGGAIDESDEKYRLNWHGKRQVLAGAQTLSLGTLRPCPDESVDWETTRNVLIEGDNLEVLKLVRKSYAGRVKMIYIDPPYNTGKDFVYPDDFRDGVRNYKELIGNTEHGERVSTNKESDGRFHTRWLNMMYPRLLAARDLLRSDGVVMVSIDDNEVANLRIILDELFGAENHLGTIVWRTATDNNPKQISTDHEYVVVYARSRDALDAWEIPSSKAPAIQQEYERLLESIGNRPEEIETALKRRISAMVEAGDTDLDGVSHYSYVDERGVFYPGNSANTRPGGYNFDIIHPATREICAKPENGYRWPSNTFETAAAAGEVYWGDDHTTVPKIKKRLATATELLKSSYYEDNRGSTRELAALMGAKVFDNPKSPRLIRRLITFAASSDGIILDFFAGSGTTGHAVLTQNAADGGTRSFVLVQFPEILDPTKPSQRIAAAYCDDLQRPRNVAEITKERLRRAAQQVRDRSPHSSLDAGFCVFKLDSTNLRIWNPSPPNIAQALLESVDHIAEDRTEGDVLYELILKFGLDLRAPIIARTIVGATVWCVDTGALFVCLATSIPRADASTIADGVAGWHAELAPRRETTVIFRDSAFASDAVKANIIALLSQHGLRDVQSL
jgi:adenine-specific DNA-methyltransferase